MALFGLFFLITVIGYYQYSVQQSDQFGNSIIDALFFPIFILFFEISMPILLPSLIIGIYPFTILFIPIPLLYFYILSQFFTKGWKQISPLLTKKALLGWIIIYAIYVTLGNIIPILINPTAIISQPNSLGLLIGAQLAHFLSTTFYVYGAGMLLITLKRALKK